MFSKICQQLKPACNAMLRSIAGRPISISLSPNTEKDDILLAFKLLFQPWRWRISINQQTPLSGANPHKSAIKHLEDEFAKYLNVRYTISFNSGRSALMAILNCLKDSGLSSEALAKEEILLQAFTCNAVPNPIIWNDLRPIYVDCNNDFNIDVNDLKRKITPRSKAVIVQHTFGTPADMDEIVAICKEYNLILIEDCAHSLGATYKDKRVGTIGDVAFFSFSRDKIISSVYGGMVATNNTELAQKIRDYQKKIGYPSLFWIKQQLLHPVLMNWKILPVYKFCGKYLLVLAQWLHILSKAVHWKEKRGMKPGYFPKAMPNALAILALNQFKKLERFNNYREEIADFYYEELKGTNFELLKQYNDRSQNYLRFAIKHPKAHEIIRKAWDNNFLIGDWYTTPIAPHDTRVDKMYYTPGSCSNAEKLARITLNLPTHINISKADAKKVVNFLKQWR